MLLGKRSALTHVVTSSLLIMIKHHHHVFTSAAEHMDISNLTRRRLKSVKQSAVSDPLLECNCSVDFDHFNIVVSDANKFRFLIKVILSPSKINKNLCIDDSP